jgi:uncharacterized membrane protein (DUF2068 family)
MIDKFKAVGAAVLVGVGWAVWTLTLPMAAIHIAVDRELQPDSPAAPANRSAYTVGAVLGVVMVCVGGAAAAVPALIAAAGVVLVYRCCAKLFLAR